MEHALERQSAALRQPETRDYVIFFGVMPLLWAAWLAASGNQLIARMEFWHGVTYIIIHCSAGWISADIGCRIARFLLRAQRPPLWKILTSGWLIMLVPMTCFYYWLTGMFADYFPAMTPYVANVQFHWTADYPLKLLRGSFPWLCAWSAMVYGYRRLAHVDWYGYETESAAPRTSAPLARVPEFIRRSSKLPLDARIFAMQADEHYVQIWSDAGRDTIRYRFSDAVRDMRPAPGLRVHRSWWVRPDHVVNVRRERHRLLLTLENGLEVPASEAYKNMVEAALLDNPRQTAS